MAERPIQIRLVLQPELRKIRSLGKDIPQLDMVVLQRAFLTGPHGITVKDPCAADAVLSAFYSVRIRELRTPIRIIPNSG